MTMKIKPLYDKVIVKRLKEEEKTQGGIYLPSDNQTVSQLAVVIATGDGKLMDDGTLRMLSIRVGDKVILGRYTGTQATIDNEELIVLKEEEILAVVE